MAEAKNDVTIGPKFALGRTVATPAALERLEEAAVDPASLLDRHIQGDWGDCCTTDHRANEFALKSGARLFSVYELAGHPNRVVWIITEADRSVTTILRPEDY